MWWRMLARHLGASSLPALAALLQVTAARRVQYDGVRRVGEAMTWPSTTTRRCATRALAVVDECIAADTRENSNVTHDLRLTRERVARARGTLVQHLRGLRGVQSGSRRGRTERAAAARDAGAAPLAAVERAGAQFCVHITAAQLGARAAGTQAVGWQHEADTQSPSLEHSTRARPCAARAVVGTCPRRR